jgi:hypothetical protein
MNNILSSWWSSEVYINYIGLEISLLAPFVFLGIIIWLFTSWKNLRQDYQEDQIVPLTFESMLIFLFASRFLYIVLNFDEFGYNLIRWLNVFSLPGFNFWAGFLVLLVFVYIFSRRHELVFLDIIEKLTIPLVKTFIIVTLGYFLFSPSIYSLLIFILPIALLLFSLYLRNYRSFLWYPSGRVGFMFFALTGIFSFYYALATMIIVRTDFTVVIGLLTTLASFYTIYLLSGRRKRV